MLNMICATMRLLHCDVLQDFHVICAVILCLLSSIVVSALKHRRSRFPLPPGPCSLPFIGHKFGPYAWQQMEAITKKYGPVSSVRLGSELLVIIGTVKPAVALLEGRSGIYCDWPRLEMAGNVISGGLQTICLGYNDRWRRFRRLLFGPFTTTNAVVVC
ncbi:hypothetical protein BY996DRAFT_7830289 [Phakopsora pachyrhizi]|nr:hypothetical protein BY996DRAFT_7830289 [Phakopsora pachyrhizi]